MGSVWDLLWVRGRVSADDWKVVGPVTSGLRPSRGAGGRPEAGDLVRPGWAGLSQAE